MQKHGIVKFWTKGLGNFFAVLSVPVLFEFGLCQTSCFKDSVLNGRAVT